MDIDFDTRLRRAADQWLTVRTNDGSRPIRWDELEEFEFDGEPFTLRDRQRGVRRKAPYTDEMGTDGLIRYKWRGDNPQEPDNVALRQAVAQRVPLIWFFGIAPGVYTPIYPVFVLAEERDQQQFVIAPDTVRGIVVPGEEVGDDIRRYVTRQTRQRLHQPVFRATVLHAYGTRCAVCALRHAELLDAAHIVPDSDDRGIASVRNGLALCKIHHAAYDVSVLGIRPDLVVEIRDDILQEIDGPMLEHGLKARHRRPLMALPHKRDLPDPELLEERYATFRAAG